MVTYEINIRTGAVKERLYGPECASRVRVRGRGSNKAEAACLREFLSALKKHPPVARSARAVCFVSGVGIDVIAEYLEHRGVWRLETGADEAPDWVITAPDE